jgi:hypothetical protein
LKNLDFCPFCGSDEIEIVRYVCGLDFEAHARCLHCAAQGGTFVEETEDEAIESVTRDWNQKSLRPNTICHKIKRFFVQLENDYYTYWHKLKTWDFFK